MPPTDPDKLASRRGFLRRAIRGAAQAAKDLWALSRAVKDRYRRQRPKTARDWPAKKK